MRNRRIRRRPRSERVWPALALSLAALLVVLALGLAEGWLAVAALPPVLAAITRLVSAVVGKRDSGSSPSQ